jgi:hypothetical protein
VAWLLEVRLRPVQLEHYTAASACSSSSSSRQQQAGRIAAQQWLAAGCAGRPPIVPWTPGVRMHSRHGRIQQRCCIVNLRILKRPATHSE